MIYGVIIIVYLICELITVSVITRLYMQNRLPKILASNRIEYLNLVYSSLFVWWIYLPILFFRKKEKPTSGSFDYDSLKKGGFISIYKLPLSGDGTPETFSKGQNIYARIIRYDDSGMVVLTETNHRILVMKDWIKENGIFKVDKPLMLFATRFDAQIISVTRKQPPLRLKWRVFLRSF